MPSSTLSIVHIDDSPDDRALVLRELKREFADLSFIEVIDAASWGKALEKEDIDLIITDFQVRWTDGLSILRTSKLRHPDCPVVMFTGTGSEEIAVEAMKAGLNDYVLKSPRHYVRLAATVRSVLERRQTERKAAHLETQLQELLNRLNVGVFRATPEGRLLECNPAFLRILRLSSRQDAHGLILHDFCFRPEDRQRIVQRLKERGHLYEYEVEWRRGDGSPAWVSLTEIATPAANGPIQVEGLIEDITERVNLEVQLRQAQKMESVGQLAAGVAHDFNNILTIIQGYTALLLANEEAAGNKSEPLRQIFVATERAANLTRQLLTFSRKQLFQARVLDLNAVLNDVSKMLRRILGEEISLQFNYAPGLPPLLGDAGMMEQIVMNLAVNARDAMPKGGRLIVSTSLAEIDAAYARRNAEAKPGRFLCLSVIDTGCGMDSATLNKIFEPFFTTKEVGKGTGLGLATVYGIVKQHRGWIEAASEPGKGTTFKVFLPVHEEGIVLPQNTPEVPSSRKGHATILLVEDDPALREMVKEILQAQDCGYRILEAGSGVEAMKVWMEHSPAIEMLLTDMKMPAGMTGLQLAEKLLALKPDLKVLYTSGNISELVENNSFLRAGINFLQKPYQPDLLVQTVRACLESTNSSVQESPVA